MLSDNISKYQQALEFMYAQLPMYHRQGASAYKKDLNNTLELCKAAGNPHQHLKTVHIAGTNGKGTVSHIIAAGLQAQGYSVGLYTSPHYKDFRERIKINGIFISRQYVVNFIKIYREDILRIQPSFFELCVCMAFCYFRDKKVDYAVIETGLGGRLDSTNVITPLLSVITNISFDHMNMLGNTLPEIAGEKAGIIKSGVPVVIGESQEAVQKIFESKAAEKNSRLSYADQHCALIPEKNTSSVFFKEYTVKTDGKIWIKSLQSPLSGPYQDKNLITGLYSLYRLSENIPIDPLKIQAIFPKLPEVTRYMGRWQTLGASPLCIADSAHNEAGIGYLLQGIRQHSFDHLHIVTGFVNDKDVTTILRLLPRDATYYFAKANIPRGMDARILQEMAVSAGLKGKAYSTVRIAFATARKKAGPKDLILITGSIFVVAEVL
jgi:dihydrofolate synthase/folylpolyglutamate synthase